MKDDSNNVVKLSGKSKKTGEEIELNPYVKEQQIYDELEKVIIDNDGLVSYVSIIGIIELLKMNTMKNQGANNG